MKIFINKKDIIWSYLGYFGKIGSNFIVLFILLRHLSSVELGVWYVFLSIGALIQLFDFGFSPTIMRNISYAFAGAKNLLSEGVLIEESPKEPNFLLISKLVSASRRLYLLISIVVLSILLSLGSIYIYTLTKQLDTAYFMHAWGIYSIGLFLNFYCAYWIPLLTGVGKVEEAQKATVISQLIYIMLAFLTIYFSFGLIGIACSFLVSGIVLRLIAKKYFYQFLKECNVDLTNQVECAEIYRTLWQSTWKLGLVFLGGFLIVQANTLLCATFFDLKSTARYGLTLQVFNALAMFSGIMLRSFLPVINQAQITNNVEVLKKYLGISLLVGWFSFSIGSAIIVIFGNVFLQLVKANTTLLDTPILVLISIYLFLEFNHGGLFATFIITRNEVPFLKPSLISGVLIVFLSLILIYYSDFGLYSLLLPQALVQLAYNNWKWPCLVLGQLQTSMYSLLIRGLYEINLMIKRRKGEVS